jgi:hypothetical protein
MKWLITKNPVRLALLILMWNLIFGAILTIIETYFKLSSVSVAGGVIAIYLVGSGYALKYHEVMDKELRHKASGISCLIQYVLAFALYFLMDLGIPLWFWLIIITITTAILYLLSMWLLGFAGRTIVKRTGKK